MKPYAILVRILTVDEWPLFRELRLEALREAPYAFGSVLGDWQGGRDTEQRWRRRLTDVPFNAIAYLEDTPAGIVSGTNPNSDGEVELISMWVAPFARGKSVAGALVDAVVSWSREQHTGRVALDVMESNARAIAFYRRCGFVEQGLVENAEDARPERRMVRTVGLPPG